jgi:hypothetical protein
VLGITGFVLQFQGIRLSGWPASVAQLLAVFTMTVVRAVIRRRLAEKPSAHELPEQHEMDYLALRMAGDDHIFDDPAAAHSYDQSPLYWEIATPKAAENPALRPKSESLMGGAPGKAQRAMKIRQRLGQLTRWQGPAFKEAIIVAKAIELIMNRLVDWPAPVCILRLRVNLRRPNSPGGRETPNTDQEIEFAFTKKGATWKVDATEIEAALSLWQYHIFRQPRRPPLKSGEDWLRAADRELSSKCHRVLGRTTGALEQDLGWWIHEDSARENRKADSSSISEDAMWWGFDGLETGVDSVNNNNNTRPDAALLLNIDAAREICLANHLFSAFMWAIADFVPAARLGRADVDPHSFHLDIPHTWDSPRFESGSLSDVAREIQSLGLGRRETIYQSLIPPLSDANKLPDEIMVDLVRDHVHQHEADCRWDKAAKAYVELLELGKRRARPDRFVCRAVAVTCEFLLQMTLHPVVQDPSASSDWRGIKCIVSNLREHLQHPDLRSVTAGIRDVYAAQFRLAQYQSLFGTGEPVGPPVKLVGCYDDKDSTDVLGWTEFDYDTVDGLGGSPHSSPSHGWGDHPDISGKSIFSYAVNFAICRDEKMAQSLIQSRQSCRPERTGRDGVALIHQAAKLGAVGVVTALIQKNHDVNIRDHAGRTALHFAAWEGRVTVVEILTRHGANVNCQDKNGRTPLIWASSNGYHQVAKLLLNHGALIEMKDPKGFTPLSYAATRGHKAVVEPLIERGASVDVEDHHGGTPFLRSVANGNEDTVELLAEKVTTRRRDWNGATALHWAARGNHGGLIARLLTRNVHRRT